MWEKHIRARNVEELNDEYHVGLEALLFYPNLSTFAVLRSVMSFLRACSAQRHGFITGKLWVILVLFGMGFEHHIMSYYVWHINTF